jgi:hypothetical protein
MNFSATYKNFTTDPKQQKKAQINSSKKTYFPTHLYKKIQHKNDSIT